MSYKKGLTFETSYEPEPNSGCWIWVGARCGGYGEFRHKYAHRVSYEKYIGPIPEGLVIDHLCRNTACVNPGHMEVVTRGENVRRDTLGHCRKGHGMVQSPRGKWYCRECAREYNRGKYVPRVGRRPQVGRPRLPDPYPVADTERRYRG